MAASAKAMNWGGATISASVTGQIWICGREKEDGMRLQISYISTFWG